MACSGEQQAWAILAGMAPDDVQRNALVSFDRASSSYLLMALGQAVYVSTSSRTIRAESPVGEQLIEGLGDLSRLSVLRYLTDSKDLPQAGQWIKPSDLPGGGIFRKGTHVLPLERLTDRYGDDVAAFDARAQQLGGHGLDYGDVSAELRLLPRVPLAVVLWSGDEEFASTASVLLDASCVRQIPIDILWSTAMVCVEMMLA